MLNLVRKYKCGLMRYRNRNFQNKHTSKSKGVTINVELGVLVQLTTRLKYTKMIH